MRGRPTELDLLVGMHRGRLLEPRLADVAPGAHGVDDDVDDHRDVPRSLDQALLFTGYRRRSEGRAVVPRFELAGQRGAHRTERQDYLRLGNAR